MEIDIEEIDRVGLSILRNFKSLNINDREFVKCFFNHLLIWSDDNINRILTINQTIEQTKL